MPSKPWERDPFNPYRFYRSVSEHLHKYQVHNKALSFNQKAESFAKTTEQRIPLFIQRCHQHFLLANSKEGEQDVRKLKRMAPTNLNAKHIHALQLYYRDDLEEALKEFYRGIFLRIKPDNFTSWVKVTMGTLEDCVGEAVGDIMSPKILGKTIVKMKMMDLKIAPQRRALSEVAKLKRTKIIEKNKKCYAEKYLGLVAQDKFFLKECFKHPAMYLTNTKHNGIIWDILKTTVEKVDVKQESLWRRKPLYFWANKSSRMSKKMEKRVKEAKIEKNRLLRQECRRQLEHVYMCLKRGDWTECYKKGEALREKLFELSDHVFPSRRTLLNSLIEILGMMYISLKSFVPNWSERQNDERFFYMMGIFRPYQSSQELFRDSFHAFIPNQQSYMKKMSDNLSLSDNHLEKVYYAYEVACCSSMKKDIEQMRSYTRLCLFESKKAHSFFWYLNSLFLLARTEFQDSNLFDAEVSLSAARELAQRKDLDDIAHFANRGVHLARRLTEEELRGRKGLEKRSDELIDNMVSMDLKINCSKILKRMETLPTDMRMSLIPGMKPLKRPHKKKEEALEEKEGYVDDSEENAIYALLEEARRRKTFRISDAMLNW